MITDMKFIKKTKDGQNSGPQTFVIRQLSIIYIVHCVLLGAASIIFLIEIGIGKIKDEESTEK
jgi:hypothetical protein